MVGRAFVFAVVAGMRSADPAARELLASVDARRFEVITLPYQDFAAMDASLALLESLGMAAVESHVRALCDRIVEWARGRSDVRLVTPADPATGTRRGRAGQR